MEIIDNPYFTKITLTIIAILVKIVIDGIIKPENDFKGFAKILLAFLYYVLPILIIIWLNVDGNIENSKLTSSLIMLNIGFFIFNYFQGKINNQYEIISKYG